VTTLKSINAGVPIASVFTENLRYMRSERRLRVTRLAVEFWTDCNRFVSSEMLKNRELQ